MFANFGSGVVLQAEASTVRVGLRVYFTLAVLLITYLGSQICVLRPKLHLLRHGRVRVMSMTGWMSAFDAARTMWLTRSNSLGLMGILMILTGVIMTVSDLTTSGLVDTIEIPGRCAINSSTVFYTIADHGASWDTVGYYVNPYEEGSKSVLRQDEANRRNGGTVGIYRYIDSNPRFRAEPRDIHGSWRCSHLGVTGTYNYTTNVTQITTDLEKKGFIYTSDNETDRSTWTYSGYNTPDGKTVQREVNIVSTNHTYGPKRQSLSPWDVRIALQHIGNFSNVYENKVMHSYHCKLFAPAVEWMWNLTDPVSSLGQWLPYTHNTIYRGGHRSKIMVPDPMSQLETGLNALFLSLGVVHGENGTSREGLPVTAGRESDLTQGCLIEKTNVPWPIILLFILVSLILLWAVIYAPLLWFLVRRASRMTPTDSSPLYVPVGLMSWVKYAVNQDKVNLEINTQRLKTWDFSVPAPVSMLDMSRTIAPRNRTDTDMTMSPVHTLVNEMSNISHEKAGRGHSPV